MSILRCCFRGNAMCPISRLRIIPMQFPQPATTRCRRDLATIDSKQGRRTRALLRLTDVPKAPSSRFLGITLFVLLFSIFCPRLASGQSTTKAAQSPSDTGAWAEFLRDFVDTPGLPGYESQLTGQIRAHIASVHPVVDSLGDFIVTLANGAPRRLIVTPIDEPGFVVSGITDDGYLRLQRLPQSGLPPIFNELYSAQPVKVGAAGGKWINGVVAGLSIHLQTGRANPPQSSDIDNMYVDIGASSAAEAR